MKRGSPIGSAAELEVYDDGGLRIYSSRFSDIRDTSSLLFESMAVGFTRQLIAITAAAAERGGYVGAWVLGFGATGLQGTVSHRLAQNMGSGTPYGEDTYKRVVMASYADLLTKPGALARKLVGPLLRAYGSRVFFESALTDPVSPPAAGENSA